MCFLSNKLEALVKRKRRGRENRGTQVGAICNPPSLLFQQHKGTKWGQCTLHMLAHSRPPSFLHHHTHTFIMKHTHTLEWITSLGLEMKRREMPASTDATRSYSGGASVFLFSLSLSLKSTVCVCCCSSCLAYESSAILADLIYLQVLEWEGLDLFWRALGTRVGGITREGLWSKYWVAECSLPSLFFTVMLLFEGECLKWFLTHGEADQTSLKFVVSDCRETRLTAHWVFVVNHIFILITDKRFFFTAKSQ